jgi:hypothetical protein
MDVYKYSSKSIALPFELLQDSIQRHRGLHPTLLAMRLGRIQNRTTPSAPAPVSRAAS